VSFSASTSAHTTNFAMAFCGCQSGKSVLTRPPPLAEFFGALYSLEIIMTSCIESGAVRTESGAVELTDGF